jgi:hypothetical protein
VTPVNIFDVIPLLGRRALNALGIAVVLGLLVLPGPTRAFIAVQFNDLRVEITHELTRLIPPQLRTQAPQLSPGIARHHYGGRGLRSH